MDFPDSESADAEKFCKFYVDLVDNCPNNLKYYLAEDVILDWFGHTIKADKWVANYLKKNNGSVKHIFENAKSVNKIGFRDSHTIKNPRETKKLKLLMSPPPINNEGLKTPPNETQPSTSSLFGKGQGDGLHNNHQDAPESPSTAKRFKSSSVCRDGDQNDTIETIEEENECQLQVKYLTVEGDIEFHRPSSKKFQTETKWRRPCKLSIAYTGRDVEDCTIYLIIYEGNIKCRRNLLKDFEAQEPDD